MYTDENTSNTNSKYRKNIDLSFSGDSSFCYINFQILDYNINLLRDVIDKIGNIISNTSNIKKSSYCFVNIHDSVYCRLIKAFVNLIEYLKNIFPILKITKKNIYKELYVFKCIFMDCSNLLVNDLIFKTFDLFGNLKGSYEWSIEIKKISYIYKRNVMYVIDVINSNKLTNYGFKLIYMDFMISKDSFEGTPIKKRCLPNKNLQSKKENKNLSTFESELCLMSSDVPDNIFIINKDKLKNNIDYCKFSNPIKTTTDTNKRIINTQTISNNLIKSTALSKNDFLDLKKLEVKFLKFSDMPREVVKIAEASFSEVFKFKNLIYKIIPLGEGSMTNIRDFIREAKVLKILKKEKGISILVDILIVTGSYPRSYLKAWDKFGFIENPRPDFYSKKQEFGILVTADGGICLENYKFKSVKKVQKVILEISSILSFLELKYNFEHRDLHWGNILILNDKIHIIDFALSRLNLEGEIIYKKLNEYSWIFEGDEEIDEQFGIYKKMKEIIKDDWEGFYPITNVLWITYLVKKLFNQLSVKKSSNVKAKYLKVLEKCCSISDFYYKIKNVS